MTEISNTFVKGYAERNRLTITSFDETKPWGGYYIYEIGPNYDKKIIWVKAGQYLSLQYHGSRLQPGHEEEWKALTNIKVVLGNINIAENPDKLDEDLGSLRILEILKDDSVHIPQGFLHALVNPYQDDIYLLETRTSTFDEAPEAREKNITRIYDQTQRDGLPKWPLYLIEQINELVI